MRRWIVVLLSVVLLAATPSAVSAYEPLTRSEAEAWLRSITLSQLIDFVIQYDVVEHATPNIEQPQFAALLLNDGTVTLTQTVPQQIVVGHLVYRATYEPISYAKLVPPYPWWRPLAIGVAVGVGVAVPITLLLVRAAAALFTQ